MAGKSKYTQEIGDKICEMIAGSSESLRVICQKCGVDYSSLKRWLLDEKNEEFRTQYARAKEDQADFMAEEMIDIADDNTKDTKQIYGKDGKLIEVEDTEWTNRSKLRIETRKWLAGKLKPKKYGDKIQTEHSGTVGVTQITGMEIK